MFFAGATLTAVVTVEAFPTGASVALPEGIKIRVARRGDRDSLYRLLQEIGVLVAPADQSNTLSWIVSHPETEVNIAVDPLDRGVGMLALSHRPQLRVGGRIATIDEFVVSASLRRKGIGSELLERGVARARMLGCKRVEVAATDDASRAFLEKRGFSTNGSQVMAWQNADAK
jgi:N-acetylglutamate synthase-like GNAT family acetyltransferase